jgi:hypothetical protein
LRVVARIHLAPTAIPKRPARSRKQKPNRYNRTGTRGWGDVRPRPPRVLPPRVRPPLPTSRDQWCRKPRSANWSRNGGTTITVAAGETVARRAETASTEPRGAARDSAVGWPNLPTPNLDARKPGTINNTYARENEPKDGEEEMPLIWPVLTEAERAGLPDSAPEAVLSPALLAGALAMVLLCVGAIFKARSSSRSSQSLARGPRPAEQTAEVA